MDPPGGRVEEKVWNLEMYMCITALIAVRIIMCIFKRASVVLLT